MASEKNIISMDVHIALINVISQNMNSVMCIIGEGMNKCEIIVADKLTNVEKFKETGANLINNKILESFKRLTDALWKLEHKEHAVLGPELCVSIAISMSSFQSGSPVILCMDALANTGWTIR